MDLNICLYCEKRLPEDNTSFCSLACQAHEASKNYSFVILDRAGVDPFQTKAHYPSPASLSSFRGLQKPNAYTKVPYMPTPPSPSSFETTYYRRRSFYLPKDVTSKASAPSMSDSLSSESSSASSSTFFASYPYADDPVASANMQLYHPQPAFIKNTANNHSSSEMDSVHTWL